MAFELGFEKARRQVLVCTAIFFGAAALGLADGYYLSKAQTPGIIPTYAFAVFFGIIIGTFPVMAYLVTQTIKRMNAGACPYCQYPIWHFTTVAIMTATLKRCPRCFKRLPGDGA